ncbi:hypothetical protein AcV5_008620 [Taiwanofungus camphoratus]|nr:hypothetical protein AcV5_008620 [Antrodia cinnamomea]
MSQPQPHFPMHAAWPPQLPPQPHQLQLEHEYDIDPAQFHVLHGGPQHRAPHSHDTTTASSSFAAYGQQAFADEAFAFADPQGSAQSVNVVYGDEQDYAGGGSSAEAGVFPAGSSVYGVSVDSRPMQQGFYGDEPPAFAYAPQPQAHAGAVFPPIDAIGATPSVYVRARADFDVRGYPMGRARAMEQPFGLQGAKRWRGPDEGAEGNEVGADHDEGQGPKPKPAGACARCKGLKVRCEFVGDADTCRRCANGGHDCVIPGRKKRRPPPKREHLLNQIHKQAAEIKALVEQLDEANRRASRRVSAGADKRASLPLSPSDLNIHSDIGVAGPDVQDWVAKARESIEAFGGYIDMGGPSVTVDMLGNDDSDPSPDDDDAEYALSVQDVDADDGELGGEGDAGAFSPGQESEEDSPSLRGRGPSPAQKLATLPSEAVPFGLMANLALARTRRTSRSRDEDREETEKVGLANENYFRPSPAPERPMIYDQHQPPHILRTGLVKPDEVEKLFKIYYDYMNLSLSLLDPVLYTAQSTYWRSPFLFTVICAIASRHYPARPALYQEAMKSARLAAGTALIGGQKSVEVVQAYILLSLYPVPARRWEDDRSFIYLGLAIRIATDLNLHHPNTATPANEPHARAMLNRTRVWLNCFNLDRSTGSQYGQPPVISNLDFVANHTEDWWHSSPYNMPGFDVHLCCYNAELKVMANFRSRIHSDPNHPSGLNKNIDFSELASEADDQLARLWETWIARIRELHLTDPQSCFRTGLLRLAFSYARLSVLSVGFQRAFSKAGSGELPFLWRCLRAATDVVKAVVDDVGVPSQRIYLRHGPEAQSVFVTFACAFLVKLLQPKYTAYLSRDQRAEIRHLVEQVIALLGSPEVAIDDRHGPKLYASFLQGLLATPMARLDHSPASVRRDAAALRRTASKQGSTASSSSSPAQRAQPLGTASARQSLSPPPGTSSSSSSPRPSTPPPATAERASSYAAQPALPPPVDFASPRFCSPPLFFDSELLQSMQTVADQNVWPDMVLPGFNWMGPMQPDDNSNMAFDQIALGFDEKA